MNDHFYKILCTANTFYDGDSSAWFKLCHFTLRGENCYKIKIRKLSSIMERIVLEFVIGAQICIFVCALFVDQRILNENSS